MKIKELNLSKAILISLSITVFAFIGVHLTCFTACYPLIGLTILTLFFIILVYRAI